MIFTKRIVLLSAFLLFSMTLAGQTADGYVLVGTSDSYTTGYGTPGMDMLVYRLDSAGHVTWFNHYGGVFHEEGVTVTPTADGGFAVAGWGYSYSFPAINFVLFKLDAGGNELWHRDYGGDYPDYCHSLRQTADGGYLLAGMSQSYGVAPGDLNILVYKTDAAGNKQWRKSLGGPGAQFLSTAIQTSDGGYLLVGDSSTYTHGLSDILVYKLDAAGNKQWRKNYGGAGWEFSWAWMYPIGRQLVETADGGYAFCGATDSYTNGMLDFIVYKIDAAGNKLWRKHYGGVMDDHAYGIDATADGGFVVAGSTQSYAYLGGDYDLLVYKIDAAGAKQWRKNFGGYSADWGMSVQQTADGGYILSGYGYSYTSGPGDFLVYKLDARGAKQWRKNYGGTDMEWGSDIREVVR